MRNKWKLFMMLAALAAGRFPAAAEQPPVPGAAASATSERMQSSVARQTASAERMTVGIERQKTAVERQMSVKKDSFFDTPAPAALPGSLLPPCDPLPEPQVDSLVETASRKEGVDADLIRDVMRQESGFRPCAVSPKGAVGLMQLMPETASDLVVANPFDPGENVTAGTKFLKRLMQQYGGDLALTLAAYNAGPARVNAKMAVPQIPETVDYVRDVLALFPGDKQQNPLALGSEADH